MVGFKNLKQGVVNINFDVQVGNDPHCSAVDVQDSLGNSVRSSIFCTGYPAVSIDIQ